MTEQIDCPQCGSSPSTIIATTSTGQRSTCRRCDAVFSVGALRPAASIALPKTFRQSAWQSTYRRRLAHAVAAVPLYRERSAPWRQPARPLRVAELAGSEVRICPFSRPWNPQREPPLWIERPDNLLTALRTTGHLGRGTVILETRDSLLDRRALGGHRYGVLLSSHAMVRSEQWRTEYNGRVLAAASRFGRNVVVVGTSAVAHGNLIERTALVETPAPGAVLLHDPWLGYLAARNGDCGVLHVNWRNYHVRMLGDQLAWTDLRRSRPTLVDVVAGSGWDLRDCPHHHVPALVIPRASS